MSQNFGSVAKNLAFSQKHYKTSQFGRLIILIREKMNYKGENYSVKLQKYYFCNGIQKLKQTFQCLYPNVTKYLHKASKEGFQIGEIRTLAGRMCKTRNLNKKEEDYKIKNKGKNLPVQRLCADMLKIAMENLFLILELSKIKLINSVHDELVFECKIEEADEVAAIVKIEMEKAGSFFLKDISCIAEVTIADFRMKE